jgi:hypothetical protein
MQNELRSLCGDPYAMPQVTKRVLPADSCNLFKKAKANSAPAFVIHDDEEYGSAIEKVMSGPQKGFKAEKETKMMAEVKEEKKPKVELDAKVEPAIQIELSKRDD